MTELLATMSFQAIPASQRLTTDVLWHLFGHVCLSDPLKGPMSVSKVSRLWRMVALHSPFIWCNITIRLYTSSQQHLWALAHFERTQNVPITLTIRATRPFKSWERNALLRPYAHRFRSLHVKASAGFLANLLWTAMDMPMPRLKTFDTIISNTSRLGVTRKIVSIDENVNIIPPVYRHNSVDWGSWNTTGLTALTLDTTRLWNQPDLDDIHHALASTCHTLQHFEYQGLVPYVNVTEVGTRLPLKFPVLRSLAVIGHDNMLPLLQLMNISALDSLTLRDFMTYPTSNLTEQTDIYGIAPTFDPDGLFQVIKRWTSITHLEISGIDDLPSDNLPPPALLNYIKSLNQLSSLVLYGIGAATSIAYTLFMHDPAEKPLLPKLTRFLLAINDVSPEDDLCDYLIARRHHRLPRLQRLSINLDYARHLNALDRIGLLLNGSDDIFILHDPVVGKYIPIKEVTLQEGLSYERNT
jgi:hypothetical protein